MTVGNCLMCGDKLKYYDTMLQLVPKVIAGWNQRWSKNLARKTALTDPTTTN